jgi:hypothetical protein
MDVNALLSGDEILTIYGGASGIAIGELIPSGRARIKSALNKVIGKY